MLTSLKVFKPQVESVVPAQTQIQIWYQVWKQSDAQISDKFWMQVYDQCWAQVHAQARLQVLVPLQRHIGCPIDAY